MRVCQFLYASLALSVLAVSDSPSTAHAQNEPPRLVAVLGWLSDGPTHVALDTSGRLYYRDGRGLWFLGGQCPPGTPVHFTLETGSPTGHVYLIGMGNGDLWTFPHPWNPVTVLPEFTYFGNPFSVAIEVEGARWEKVKEAYRR